eukprot:2884885-Amphidinium_carterae.1
MLPPQGELLRNARKGRACLHHNQSAAQGYLSPEAVDTAALLRSSRCAVLCRQDQNITDREWVPASAAAFSMDLYPLLGNFSLRHESHCRKRGESSLFCVSKCVQEDVDSAPASGLHAFQVWPLALKLLH